METLKSQKKFDYLFFLGIAFLIIFSVVILRPIEPSLFPVYFLYITLALVAFFVFSQIDFDILVLFSKQFYVGSIIFLILPLLIGQVTRGAIRWIPIGPLTIQPAEIVRPFLFIFFANYLSNTEISQSRFLKVLLLLAIPVLLIVIQPSLGVAILTVIGFLGVFFASGINKKHLLLALLGILIIIPLLWQILAPYQKGRILTFLEPSRDPLGGGYNSIQAMISVGSGKILGRGLGKGVQTQLSFLPERHTDFIFASISEELGFLGAILIIFGELFILSRIIATVENAQSLSARAFASGIFLSYFVQTIVHIGMNMGIFPITGIPLPLVSAGGSSLLATMISLGMVVGAKK